MTDSIDTDFQENASLHLLQWSWKISLNWKDHEIWAAKKKRRKQEIKMQWD